MLKWQNNILTLIFVFTEGLVMQHIYQQSLKKVFFFALISLFNLILISFLKKYIHKPRPILQAKNNAWPSRHSYAAFYIYASAINYLPPYFILLAFYLAYLRIKLFAHDLNDVLAGSIIGFIFGLSVHCIVDYLF